MMNYYKKWRHGQDIGEQAGLMARPEAQEPGRALIVGSRWNGVVGHGGLPRTILRFGIVSNGHADDPHAS